MILIVGGMGFIGLNAQEGVGRDEASPPASGPQKTPRPRRRSPVARAQVKAVTTSAGP